MKKIALLLISAVLLPLLPLRAGGDDTLDRIEATGAALTSLEGSFSQTKTVKANGKTSSFSGTFYFVAPGQLAMAYKEATEGLVLSNGKFFIRRGGKAHKGELKHNKQMEQLSDVLFGCLQGRVRAVAEDNDATSSVKKDKDGTVVVTLLARKKSSKGFARIVLRYRPSDLLLTGVLLEEGSGNINEYTLTTPVAGGTIPASRFEIPKK